jgi:hypothetical protein
MKYQDIIYEVKDRAAYITINRPEKYNAFRGITCDELIHAFQRAGWDKEIGVIVFSGAATRRSAPVATSPPTTVSTTDAAPSACRWKNSIPSSAMYPSR